MQRQKAVIRQSERRHSEAASRAKLECPSRQQLVELLVDVGMLHEIAGGIDLQHGFDDGGFPAREFRVGVLVRFEPLLSVRRSENLQKSLVISDAGSIPQLPSLRQRVWQDLRFQNCPGCVFNQRVARLELAVLRYFTNAEHDGTTIGSDLQTTGLGSKQFQ